MDAEVAISKVRTGIDRLLRDNPEWTGWYKIKMRFRKGKVLRLKKVAVDPVL